MHDITNYVRMIANSMSVELSDQKIREIAHELLEHRDYNKMLVHLENMIRFAKDA